MILGIIFNIVTLPGLYLKSFVYKIVANMFKVKTESLTLDKMIKGEYIKIVIAESNQNLWLLPVLTSTIILIPTALLSSYIFFVWTQLPTSPIALLYFLLMTILIHCMPHLHDYEIIYKYFRENNLKLGDKFSYKLYRFIILIFSILNYFFLDVFLAFLASMGIYEIIKDILLI